MDAYLEGETGLTINKKLREKKKKHRSATALAIDHTMKRYNRLRHRCFPTDNWQQEPQNGAFNQDDFARRLKAALTQGGWKNTWRCFIRHLSHLGSHLPNRRAPTLANNVCDINIKEYFDSDAHIARLMRDDEHVQREEVD